MNGAGFSIVQVVSIAALLGALAVYSFLGYKDFVARRERVGLLVMRLLAVAFVALLCFNPFNIERTPDPDRFTVAVLADASQSMNTPDLAGGGTRLEWLNAPVADLDAEGSTSPVWLAGLESEFPVRLFSFASDARPQNPGAPLATRAGQTAIGTSLGSVLSTLDSPDRPLAGVVLLSDGISWAGESPFDVAKRFRERGIPVSTVGIGEMVPPGDLSLAFEEAPEMAVFGEQMALTVLLRNDFDSEKTVRVGLFSGDSLLEEKAQTIPAYTEQRIVFSTTPDASGFQLYRARIMDEGVDANPGSDVALAGVDVTEPETLKVLFMHSEVNYFYRFLKIAMRDEVDAELSGIIQLAPERFLYDGFDEADERVDSAKLPERLTSFFDHSVWIMDTGILAMLSEEAQEDVRRFLVDRGGGLLLTGDFAVMPESLRAIAPVKEWQRSFSADSAWLELERDPVFFDAGGGVLFSAEGLQLPGRVGLFLATEQARGSRPMLLERSSGATVAALQAYGAGRVIYAAEDMTWRWRMANRRGEEQHTLYWRYLVNWLGAGGFERVESVSSGDVRAVGDAAPLDVTVRGADFRLAENARVSAVVTTPEGITLPEQLLTPDITEPGRYSGGVMADAPGEYRIDYRIEFIDTEEVVRNTDFFAATYRGLENEDVAFREPVLRDIARITGGRYWNYRDLPGPGDILLAENTPVIEERVFWTRSWWFLALLGLLSGGEWLWRRRVGLR